MKAFKIDILKIQKIFIFISLSLFLFYQPTIAGQSSFKLHTDKGCEYLEKNAFDDAIREFESALKLDPDNSKAHSNLALARTMKYIEMVNYGLPIEQVESISKDGKVDLKEYDRLKKEWDNLADELLKASQKGFKKAIELDDNNWHAHYFVGTHYYNTGDLKAAEAELKRTIELNPEYTNSYGALVSVYEKMGKIDLAIAYCKKLLEIDPKEKEAKQKLNSLYYK